MKPAKRTTRGLAAMRAGLSCEYLGKQIGERIEAGCSMSMRKHAIYECSKHGITSLTRRVLKENANYPDTGVAVCFGCPLFSEAR